MSNRLVATCAMIACIAGGAKTFFGLLIFPETVAEVKEIWGDTNISWRMRGFKILKAIS